MIKETKKIGIEFVGKVDKVQNKQELFGLLFTAVDKTARIENMDVNQSPLAVSLAAFKATRRMQSNEDALQSVLKQITMKKAISYDTVLLNRLTFHSPSNEDYAHIAMDRYFKNSYGKTFKDFEADWKKYRPKEIVNVRANNTQAASSVRAG